jgi:hypothetical protein
MEEGRLPRNTSRRTHIHHLNSIPTGNNSCCPPIPGEESSLLENLTTTGEKNEKETDSRSFNFHNSSCDLSLD